MKVLLLNESPHPNGCTATALKERISVFDAEGLQTMRNLAHNMTFLMKGIDDPLCAFCQAEGKLVPATVVDHIIQHRGDQRLFWDQSNWESLCKECHDKKTGSGL